jgi:hypothetical protein
MRLGLGAGKNKFMQVLLEMRQRVPPRLFLQLCLLFSALLLLGILPCLVWFNQKRLPPEIRPDTTHRDFVQYYVGALVVRHGIWDALYPEPKFNIYNQPSVFTPIFKTFLFNPKAIHGNLAFYPVVNLPEASDCSPKLTAYLPQAASQYRYIYPPPAALLVWPLSFVSFDCAAYRLWPTISFFSYFFLALFSSRTYRLLHGAVSYTEGAIVLACTIFTYRGYSDIYCGNITPILSALMAFSSYSFMRGWQLSFCCALIPLILFKTIGLTWLPALLCNRRYWRSLAYLTVLTLLLNGVVLGIAGFGVYKDFFSLLPKILIPAGHGIVAVVIYIFGFYPRTLYSILNTSLLAVMYYGYYKNSRHHMIKSPDGENLPLMGALFAGITGLYCLFNFSIWMAYCPNYLFFPFLGWILYEGFSTSGKWRFFILGGCAVSFAMFITKWMVNGSFFYLLGPGHFIAYFRFVYQPFSILLTPLFVIIVAMRRLLCNPSRIDVIKQAQASQF